MQKSGAEKKEKRNNENLANVNVYLKLGTCLACSSCDELLLNANIIYRDNRGSKDDCPN